MSWVKRVPVSRTAGLRSTQLNRRAVPTSSPDGEARIAALRLLRSPRPRQDQVDGRVVDRALNDAEITVSPVPRAPPPGWRRSRTGESRRPRRARRRCVHRPRSVVECRGHFSQRRVAVHDGKERFTRQPPRAVGDRHVRIDLGQTTQAVRWRRRSSRRPRPTGGRSRSVSAGETCTSTTSARSAPAQQGGRWRRTEGSAGGRPSACRRIKCPSCRERDDVEPPTVCAPVLESAGMPTKHLSAPIVSA